MKNEVVQTIVHLIHRKGVPIAFFYRKEACNDPLIYTIKKVKMEDLKDLFAYSEEKI